MSPRPLWTSGGTAEGERAQEPEPRPTWEGEGREGCVLGGKNNMCGSGPRGTQQGQFLLRSPIREAECVPEDSGQGGSWQVLCERMWLAGEQGGLWPGRWENLQGGEGQWAP